MQEHILILRPPKYKLNFIPQKKHFSFILFIISIVFLTELIAFCSFKFDLGIISKGAFSIVIIVCLILIVLQFLSDENNPFNSNEDNDYYKAYFKVLIDSLTLSNKQIDNVKILEGNKRADLTPYLNQIEGVFLHLSRVTPPKKYREYHEDVLFELKSFLNQYDRNIGTE